MIYLGCFIKSFQKPHRACTITVPSYKGGNRFREPEHMGQPDTADLLISVLATGLHNFVASLETAEKNGSPWTLKMSVGSQTRWGW